MAYYKSLLTRTVSAHSSNYGGNRTASKIKYIVIHYTGNDGDSDEGNLEYFQQPNRKASAHFFVDDDSISLSVPLSKVAWHCGGSKYNDTHITGGGKFYGVVTNTNSIGIEMCDTERNGVYNLSTKTRNNVIKLVRALMKDYNIDIDHVVRHFDVTGKYCPRYFMDESLWKEFKAEIVGEDTTQHNNNYNVQAVQTPTTSTTSNNSKQAGVQADVPFRVKVKCDLNIRAGASTKYKKTGVITDNGVYTITRVSGHWGFLKSQLGWISILNEYVKRV